MDGAIWSPLESSRNPVALIAFIPFRRCPGHSVPSGHFSNTLENLSDCKMCHLLKYQFLQDLGLFIWVQSDVKRTSKVKHFFGDVC